MAAVVLASAAFGFAASWVNAGGLVGGAVAGGLIGLALGALETLLQGPWAAVRRWPVTLLLLFRTVIYVATFFVAVHLSVALLLWSWQPILHPTRLLNAWTVLLSLVFSLAVNLMLILRRLLGARVLLSLFTGRYHRPREEECVVLFMDLRGSTQLAERIGAERFHHFLNHVFSDLTDPVLEARGEIYRYVGDEVIVTWPVQRGGLGSRCIECVFAIENALAARRAFYMAEFGTEPRMRAALHAGPLIIGEMGDLKREFVMLGDTMNTTARIEDACRTLARDVIASGPALRLFKVPQGVRAESLGTVALRGKESELELFALERDGNSSRRGE
jgi:adenylate cyclase